MTCRLLVKGGSLEFGVLNEELFSVPSLNLTPALTVGDGTREMPFRIGKEPRTSNNVERLPDHLIDASTNNLVGLASHESVKVNGIDGAGTSEIQIGDIDADVVRGRVWRPSISSYS